MCGIVAYIGERQAFPILIKGLQRLEYRGYDSAGVALFNPAEGETEIKVYKRQGKVKELLDFSTGKSTQANIGIGHTRWATHGAPNHINAHPHISGNKQLAIIHNGIIENYDSLRMALEKEGHEFESETDTEVLIHLIEEIQKKEAVSIEEAVRMSLSRVIGAYAIVIIDKTAPDRIIAARKGSPMVLGLGESGEFFIASDASPIVEYTKNVVYLNDEEILIARDNGEFVIKNIGDEIQTPFIQYLEMEIDTIEKGGFDHYMLKEIYQQPKTIADAMRGRINAKQGIITLGGINEFENRFLNADRIIIAACGTSWIAGLIGEHLFEDLARIPTEVEYASEFRYRNPIIKNNDIVLAISQSGETADTIAALELARDRDALLYGICNVVGSSIARMTDAGSYIHAGPEIGVASTKAFTGQLVLLTLMALQLARKKGTISSSYFFQLLNELENIPAKVESLLQNDAKIKYVAQEIKDANNALYLGRGYNFPVALEGALKLKEISYIHAEGYPAAEMKHGPIALIDENMPVIVVASNDSTREKVISNIQEVKARKGKVIAIIKEGDQAIEKLVDYAIEIPDTEEPLSPLLSVIPLQLLAYHIAILRDCNVDQPRNLAKSVTVE
ncbi:glutamine--fructose-6-phosphate transaminase (isomerizing) [Saprospira grandis]|uniref:Glutamine--fructose-6-phosphate aminotransferase [isomerizing] n=1 Tax=Saprospira grandis (strain Lewin) TaxID=984262 RepID=H6L437_SAPGL|nr:glutamine--fructose-6-phosphate transaminase (isomerizing) [Saprospira grandis]AFC25021.1 glucosamine--fructose-6-phosphate aminotransferase [Saprospira grandis str. Lewin]